MSTLGKQAARLWNYLGFNSTASNAARLRVAAVQTVESLEARRLLSAAPAPFVQTWEHARPKVKQAIAIFEGQHPKFKAELDAILTAAGLPLLPPAIGVLPEMSSSARKLTARAFKSHVKLHAKKQPKSHRAKHETLLPFDLPNPTVTSASFYYNTLPQQVSFTFSADVSASITTANLSVENTSVGGSYSPSSVTYDSGTNTATFNFSSTAPLPDGLYTAVLSGSLTKDASSDLLIGSDGIAGHNYSYQFYFLDGDFNHDGTVDTNDFNLLVENFGHTGATFSEGDADYSGTIDMNDYYAWMNDDNETVYMGVPYAITGQTTPTTALISWSDNGPNASNFNVFRNGVQIAADIPSASYNDTGLTPGTSYVYTVQATDGALTSLMSNEKMVATSTTSSEPTDYTATAPTVPANVQANPSGSSIQVTWSASSGSGTITYEVERNGVQVGATQGTSFTDSTALAGDTYTYSIVAVDSSFNASAPGTAASGASITDAQTPNAPLDLQVTQNSSSGVTISWVQPWDATGVTGYNFYRTGDFTQREVSGTSCTDTSAVAGDTYTYYVQAISAGGYSTASQINVTVPSGTPSFDASPSQIIPIDWQNYLYEPTNGLIAVLRQKMAVVGLTPTPVANWYDATDSLIPSSGVLPSEPTLVHGTTGQYAYYDRNGSGLWSSNDPIWLIASGDGTTFQLGESTVYTPSGWTGPIPTGTVGRTNGIMAATDAHGNPLIWVDAPSSFRNDLVSVYQDVERLIPYFAPPDTATAYSVGSLLQTIGAQTVAGNGDIVATTVTQNSSDDG
jgi:hypothetical protein